MRKFLTISGLLLVVTICCSGFQGLEDPNPENGPGSKTERGAHCWSPRDRWMGTI